jgi:hypothetical protein
MNRPAFIVSSVLLLMMFSACEGEIRSGQQNAVGNSSVNVNSSATNSNTGNNTGESVLTIAPALNNRNTETVPPQIFSISDAEVEKAFAEGERLYQDIRRRDGNPPVFGKENKVEFHLPTRAKLLLSVVFKTPRDEAKERGFLFAKQGAASERAEILSRTKQIVAQRSKQVVFQVHVKQWSNPDFGDDNTPSVQFAMKDAADNPVRPTNTPQLDFCVGRDIISCAAGTAIVFPLYRSEQPLLTNTMEFVTLIITVDGAVQETAFRLR